MTDSDGEHEKARMAIPERVREFLKEFVEVQEQPVTDVALVERMRTEATTWINAVHMQHRRVSHPVVDLEAPGDEVWRQEVDLHFLLVALTRLRRAVGLTTRVSDLQDGLPDYLVEFDSDVPSLTMLRNVAEHFDDYTTTKGRVAEIKRHALQVWNLDADPHRGLVWRWLGMEFCVDVAHHAAATLYRKFLADVNEYLVGARR